MNKTIVILLKTQIPCFIHTNESASSWIGSNLIKVFQETNVPPSSNGKPQISERTLIEKLMGNLIKLRLLKDNVDFQN